MEVSLSLLIVYIDPNPTNPNNSILHALAWK